jgi:hypothetical protein
MHRGKYPLTTEDEMLEKEKMHWRGIEKHGYDPTP